MSIERKYPVGIQSFEKLRKDGYLYVDKTPLIYKMITEGCPYFLSRPRRFGKSLLISTLQAVFEGRRDLFEAFTTEQGIEQPQLFIAQTDWKWEKHPVIRFDFSETNLKQFVKMEEYALETLLRFEERYGLTAMVKSHSLAECVRNAHEKTGQRVVVLVDEYDTLMLHSIGHQEQMDFVRDTFSALFGPLKSLDEHLQLVFITGISKFSQMGVFSKLNNLMNISMRDDYAAICGLSEKELLTRMRPDIELMAQRNGTTFDDMFAQLKARYDGYHFSRAMEDIYNPFSLVNAFASGELDDYWFDRGTSGAVIQMLAQMPPVDFAELEGIRLPSTAFDLPFETFDDPLPILYQSGYLTIKAHRRIGTMNEYKLGFPNQEVRQGFADCLFRHVAGKQVNTRQTSVFLAAYNDFYESADLSAFIESLKAFFAGVPYQWERDNRNEHYYHSLLYTLLVAFGADIRAEEPSAKGCADITLLMPKGIYVMEIKYNDTAEAALEQIDRKGYADKYALDDRPVTKIGISFSSEERNITAWKSIEQ